MLSGENTGVVSPRWPSRVQRAPIAAFLCACGISEASAQVQVPVECGSAAGYAAAVGERLPSGTTPPVTTLSIDREADGYVLRMQVGVERRELRDADCRELLRAAVVITVAAATSEANEQRARRTQPIPPTAARRARPETELVVSDEASPPHALKLTAAAGMGVNVALLPRPVLAVELEAGLDWGPFGIVADGRYLAPGEEQDASGRGVSVHAWGLAIAALYRVTPALEARAGASVYRLSGTGLGSDADTTDFTWAGGPVAGLSFLPLRKRELWVALAGELHADIPQSQFEILNYDEVFQVPLWSASFFLRLGHQFF